MEDVTAEGRGETSFSAGSKELNSTSRSPGSAPAGPTTVAGVGAEVVTGSDDQSRLRSEAAGDGRELQDIVPQSAVPCPSREETVESRTAVSERVS